MCVVNPLTYCTSALTYRRVEYDFLSINVFRLTMAFLIADVCLSLAICPSLCRGP